MDNKTSMYRSVYQIYIGPKGTVRPANPFNVEDETDALTKAMKGSGKKTDEPTIIDILTNCSSYQRQQIAELFKQKYDKDLVKELKSNLSGNLENLMLALMVPSSEFDAVELKKAVKGLGTDDEALIEIMCSRNNSEIANIKEVYRRLYKCELEKDIADDTSGSFKKLMVSLSTGARQEGMSMDITKAQTSAQALYEAGEKRVGTDEGEFNAVLAFHSYAQLRLVFDEYEKLTKHSLEDAIKKEMSFNLKKAMLTIVKCANNKNGYFAEKLHKSLKKGSIDNKTLIRIVVGRSEVDLLLIKREFANIYQKSLESFIESACSGIYRTALLMLVKE